MVATGEKVGGIKPCKNEKIVHMAQSAEYFIDGGRAEKGGGLQIPKQQKQTDKALGLSASDAPNTRFCRWSRLTGVPNQKAIPTKVRHHFQAGARKQGMGRDESGNG
jgi:hypothetical protein